MASSSSRVSREDMLRKKAEDEARKAGTLPAERDAQGREINPHIPQFMKVAPWYVGSEMTGLDHQRLPESQKYSSDIHAGWYERGRVKSQANSSGKATCTNCGSSTHVTKNCLEKPRKSVYVQGKDNHATIQPTQPVLNLSFDGKRDMYNGLDADAQMRSLQRRGLILTADKNEEDEKEKQAKKDANAKASLRVRSDTAKYLRNLDPESAFYDPKTRSMRANPNPDLMPDQVTFAGDNFVRNSGEAIELDKMEAFAMSSTPQTVQANPTAVALARKEFEERRERLAAERKRQMEELYGSSQATSAPVDNLPKASSAYAEYAPDGRMIGGVSAVPSSRYDEDILERNHTAIWGSYFDPHTMSWGFACCWQTTRNSYCTGDAGRQAIRESLERSRPKDLSANEQVAPATTSSDGVNTAAHSETVAAPLRSSLYGEGSVDAQFDKKKLDEALHKIQGESKGSRRRRNEGESSSSSSSSDWSSSSSDSESDRGERRKRKRHRSHKDDKRDKKRSKKSKKKHKKTKDRKHHRHGRDDEDSKEHSSSRRATEDAFGRDGRETTAEELEAFRLTRIRDGDPMAQHFGH